VSGRQAVPPGRDERLVLSDGRVLAWCEWGTPSGHPVLLFHGMPGSRMFCPDDAVTSRLGVRLVTYDRPGYGASASFEEQPSVLDYAPDALALLDHLELDRVGVVGWSGGGCFAAGLAAAAPERVGALALVSSPGPLDEVPGAWAALDDLRRPTAEMARQDPSRALRAITRQMEPYLREPTGILGSGRGSDGHVRRDPVHGPMLRSQIEVGLAAGAGGIAADLVASWLPWGLHLDEIAVPTSVFHGAADRHNAADTQTFADRIPDATLAVWPDDGHLGVIRHWDEILSAVTAHM